MSATQFLIDKEGIEEALRITTKAIREERKVWEKAIRSVRCILPDDAEDVEREAHRIRKAEEVDEYG